MEIFLCMLLLWICLGSISCWIYLKNSRYEYIDSEEVKILLLLFCSGLIGFCICVLLQLDNNEIKNPFYKPRSKK